MASFGVKRLDGLPVSGSLYSLQVALHSLVETLHLGEDIYVAELRVRCQLIAHLGQQVIRLVPREGVFRNAVFRGDLRNSAGRVGEGLIDSLTLLVRTDCAGPRHLRP